MIAKNRAFTLVEILISVSILSIVLVLSSNIFLTNYRASQQSAIENALMEDARFIMLRLTELIHANRIDYEEYFSNAVVQANLPENQKRYGINHNLYAWQFVDGGKDLPPEDPQARPDGQGLLCQTPEGDFLRFPNEACGDSQPVTFSQDEPTGTHPNSDYAEQQGLGAAAIAAISSICAPDYQTITTAERISTGLVCGIVTLAHSHSHQELYLIDQTTSQKTIIKLKKIDSETGQRVLSMIELGNPQDNQSDLTKFFTCTADYACPFIDDNKPELGRTPSYNNEGDVFDNFLPISPFRTNILDVQFIISPLEDPNLAFSELDSSIRIQPQVTILLTVEPAEQLKSIFNRQDLSLELQTTVTTEPLQE